MTMILTYCKAREETQIANSTTHLYGTTKER